MTGITDVQTLGCMKQKIYLSSSGQGSDANKCNITHANSNIAKSSSKDCKRIAEGLQKENLFEELLLLKREKINEIILIVKNPCIGKSTIVEARRSGFCPKLWLFNAGQLANPLWSFFFVYIWK